MTLNIEKVVRRIAQRPKAVLLGCFLLLALSGRAQQLMLFDYEHEGHRYIGKVRVDLSKQLGVGNELVLPEGESSFLLILSDLNFGNEALLGTKLVVRKSYLPTTGGIKLDDGFQVQELKPGSVMQLPIIAEIGGNASIGIRELAVKFSDGTEYTTGPSVPFLIKLSIIVPTVETPMKTVTDDDIIKPPAHKPGPIVPPKDEKLTEISAAEKEWNEIKTLPASEKEQKLKEFIDRHPGSKWADEARRQVHVEPMPTSTGPLTYNIFARYALDPVVDLGSDTTIEVKVEKIRDDSIVLRVTLEKDSNYVLKMVDNGKDERFAKFEVPLGNNLIVSQLAMLEGVFYAVRLSKGNPPFRIYFYQNNQQVARKEVKTTDTEVVFRLADLEDLLSKSNGGRFEVRIKEVNTSLSYAGGHLDLPITEFPWKPIAIAVSAFALLVFANWLRKKIKHRQYGKKIEEAATRKAEENGTFPVLVDAFPDSPATTTIDEKKEANMMTIKSHTKASAQSNKNIPDETEFLQMVGMGDHLKFDLTCLWQNTAITELHFSRKSILDLNAFLLSHSVRKLEEHDGMVPEIGGFLLGRYYHAKAAGLYRVAAEEFVPVTPKMHNVYQLEFSTAGIVQELGEAQEQFPDLALVAWFHTHPGHGLFLSSPDLAIHDGFFKEGYQFAMEIDSLAENLDTGFFTRTAAGRVNNKPDLRPEASWFKWREIENAAKG